MVLILLLVACDARATALMERAAARADAFDLMGALELAKSAGECDDAAGAVEYLEGLIGAAAAVRSGGTVESLQEVRSASNALSRRAESGDRKWEAAAFALRAVAAASQYERDEMALYLAEATRIEALLRVAGAAGIPFISAHELAGDLWLQVHRFEDARAAYQKAAGVMGSSGRIHLGLARASSRLADTGTACREYQALIEWWNNRGPEPAEIAEARRYVQSFSCTARSQDRR